MIIGFGWKIRENACSCLRNENRASKMWVFFVYIIRVVGGWVVAQVNIPVYFAHMLDATQHMLCSRNMQHL